ncbi:MAG: sensor histidine kinase, partial [Acidobacteriota bacterium]
MSPRDRDVSSDPAGHPAPLKAEGSRPLVMAAHATPALVLALGLISIGLLLWTCHESEQTAVDLVRVQNAVHGLELAVATSHLWLEEFLTGDPDVDIDEVWSDLDRALSLVLAVMQGGAPGLAGEPVTALKDPHLRESGEALKDRLIHLKSFSLERYQEHAGIGTAMDQEFDALFIGILDDSRRLSEGLRDLAARERRRSRLYLGLIIGVWLGLVIAAVGALTARDRRRRHAERILRQKEAELRQAQKLEAVGRLAGGLAHDISNYLGAIRGYCEVCRLHCGGDPAQVRRMDAAMDTASEASHLIRRLLSFSRMDLVQPRVVDMSGIVQSMEDLLRHLIGEETRLCTSCAPDLWPVRIDPSQ